MPGRRRGDAAEVDVGRRAAIERVCTRRIASRPRAVGRLDGDAAIEAARPQQRGVEHVGAVGRRRSRSRWSTESKPSISVRIWLSVCSRSSLPPLKPATPEVRERPIASSSSMKTIAGAGCLGLGEQVAHARGADADDRLDELRGRHREEGHVRLAGDRAGEQRLAGAGRAAQQHPVRDARRRASGSCSGRRRKSTTSLSSSLASSMPATSAKVTRSPRGLVAARARAPEGAEHALHVARAAQHPEEEPEKQERRAEADEQVLPPGRARGERLGVDDHAACDRARVESACVLAKAGISVCEAGRGARAGVATRRCGTSPGSRCPSR